MTETSIKGSVGSPRIHFPIEGHSIWPVVLWVLLFSSAMAVFAISLVLNMIEISNLPLDKDAIMMLVAGFFVLEYLAILKLIVPNMTDYGRYRIYEDRVDFYPLVLLGLCVTNQYKGEPASSFKGARVTISLSKDRPTLYRVELVHPRKGYTLKVKNFLDMPDAQIYARELAEAMKLPLIDQD
jgi:hypothetical protein